LPFDILLAEPLVNELVIFAVCLDVCKSCIQLLEQLCVALLYSECEFFVVSERVSYELGDISVVVEVSLSYRLVYDNALNLAVLELQLAVSPLVENNA